MDIDKLLSAAADYGFPMLVSSYLLVRMEGRIEKISPTFCGVVAPPTLFVVIFAPTFFVVRYNTLCGQCYNTFCGFAITNFVVLLSSVYLNDK